MVGYVSVHSLGGANGFVLVMVRLMFGSVRKALGAVIWGCVDNSCPIGLFFGHLALACCW